jgi:hypothetical protein
VANVADSLARRLQRLADIDLRQADATDPLGGVCRDMGDLGRFRLRALAQTRKVEIERDGLPTYNTTLRQRPVTA